jgi:hypothetical protein
VRGAKPGAKIYARFSDPDTAIDGELPIYLAGHFYGAGRVFFLASGEVWRLRAVDETYFEQFYTKLIRFVSQGRLLRDSRRGVLMADKDRCLLGDTVTLRARLTDAQFRPLTTEQVEAVLIHPDGTRQAMTLRKIQEASRDGGMYAGQFPALAEGDYRVDMPVPNSPEQEILSREIRVRVPDRELEQPERNDPLLSNVARGTGGTYYVGLPAAMGRQRTASLTNILVPQDQQTYLPGTPDKDFERRLMAWLLAFICGALCLEWLVRRLNKLA